MNTLGLHTFAIASRWDPGLIAPHLPVLQGHGVGLLEVPLLRPSEIDVDGTKALARRQGVELICSLGLPASFDIVERPEEALDFLTAALDVAARLGSPALSGVTYGTIGKTTGAPPTERELDAVCHLIEAGAARAARLGLKLGVEPCNRYETHLMNRAIDGRRILERVGAANTFIHLDTYHMHIEEGSFRTAFAEAGDLLGYVHLSESNRGTPGSGMLRWADAFSALVEAGYAGALTLESFNQVDAALASGLAVWRPVAENPDDVVAKGLPFLRDGAAAAGMTLGR